VGIFTSASFSANIGRQRSGISNGDMRKLTKGEPSTDTRLAASVRADRSLVANAI